MRNKFIENIYLKKQIYGDVIDELSLYLKENLFIKSGDKFKSEVMEREENGNIEIYPGVILPHIQSNNIMQSQIFIIKNKDFGIIWHDKSIKLIILINLRETETKNNLLEIKSFIKNLADEDFIEGLMK